MDSFVKHFTELISKLPSCDGCEQVKSGNVTEFKKQTTISSCSLRLAMLCYNMEIKLHAYSIADGDAVTETVSNCMNDEDINVARSLLSHPKLDKSITFAKACIRGKLDIATLMLDQGADPKLKGDKLITKVIKNGHLEVFKFLMRLHTLVDLLDTDHVEAALQQSDPEYIRVLLTTGSVNITKSQVKTIEHAKVYEYVRTLYPKFAADDLVMLEKAVLTNNIEMVNYLLSIVDPTKGPNNLYFVAVGAGNKDMIDILDRDGRVDITDNGTNKPLKLAIVKKNINIALRLMKSEKVYKCNLQQ